MDSAGSELQGPGAFISCPRPGPATGLPPPQGPNQFSFNNKAETIVLEQQNGGIARARGSHVIDELKMISCDNGDV